MSINILVIDDEESIRFTFSSFLSNAGYEVLTAADYASALEIISRHDLDLIFADIILKEQTGIDILREVKDRGLRCPVVIITGVPNIENAAESVRLGAFDYLAKPLKKEAIMRIANLALHHKALVDEKHLIEAKKERYRCNMEAIFRSVKEGIVTVDNKMRIIEANEAMKNICGVLTEEITGQEFVNVLNRCHKSCHKILEETLHTKGPVQEHRIECRYQPSQIVELTCSPLIDINKNFKGAVLVIRDITRLTDLENELRERHQFHNIIGKSKKMHDIYSLIKDLAGPDTSVLITGESGTGKELIAQALHYSSNRAHMPLVKVNCSALTESLLESELFGHVKGAFTGAIENKKGYFHAADGGIILLDEIGDISPKIQLKLLRILEEKAFEHVGDSTPIKLNVRIIAATNSDLKQKVRMGEFRADLYYRLKVVEITMPPLRERREDIPLLVNHFRSLFNKSFKKNIEGVSDEVLNTFMSYPWTGNVRELEHTLEHAFVLCHGKTIITDHLPGEIKNYTKNKIVNPEKISIDEQQNILQTLSKTGWNKVKAARLLGISRQTIYRKIDKYKLSEPTD